MATNNKPAMTLRRGIVKAAIWENMSKNGPFFSTTLSRSYKDHSGNWRNGTSFSLNDLEARSPLLMKRKSGLSLMS
jgi:hypothetical protein